MSIHIYDCVCVRAANLCISSSINERACKTEKTHNLPVMEREAEQKIAKRNDSSGRGVSCDEIKRLVCSLISPPINTPSFIF